MTSTIGQIRIALMTQDEAEAIADWHYKPPYDFYDTRADAGDHAELLDPAKRRDQYFSACASKKLVGFFQLGRVGDTVVVGLGLRPDLTGRGLGLAFLEQGLDFARKRFAPTRFRLSVAAFNQRAIRVYERAGFIRTRSFDHETNGGVFRFVEMERAA